MNEPKIMYECFLCRSQFQFGPHAYRGKPINAWDMVVCDTCYKANWDGIVPLTYPHLIARLKSRGIGISLNRKGWIDWPQH